jgi:hypothetical protein
MSESDVTVDKVHTIVAGATHGVRAEGAAFGIGATKSSEDDVKIRAVTGVALQDPHAFTGDVHRGATSSATMTSGVHTMGEFRRTISHMDVGTSVDMKPKATMRGRGDRFVERDHARTIAGSNKVSGKLRGSNRDRRNRVVEGKIGSSNVGNVGKRSGSKGSGPRERVVIRGRGRDGVSSGRRGSGRMAGRKEVDG